VVLEFQLLPSTMKTVIQLYADDVYSEVEASVALVSRSATG